MQGELAPASGLSSRRSACDRCKGQKLRCLRDPGEERCYRCARADARCATTPTLQTRGVLGRRVGSGPGPGLRRRQRQNSRQQSAPAVDANETIDALLASVIPLPGDIQDTLLYPHEATGSWDSNVYGLTFGDGFEGNIAPSEVETGESNVTLSSRSGTVNPSTYQSSISSIREISLQELGNNRDNGVPFSLEDITTTPDSVVRIGLRTTEDGVQRLSRINLDLVTLLSCISQGPPEITLDVLISPIDGSDSVYTTPIHDVLNMTRRFTNILSTLSKSAHRPETPSFSDSSSPQTLDPRIVGDIDISVAEEHDVPPFSQYSLAPADPPPRLATEKTPKSSLDAATLLLILASYIHITRLYLVIFAHSYDFFLEVSRNDEPSLCAVPGMDFSNFPLQSGNLQATMFIQVVINLFERMETYLGIPQQFRVGPRGANNGGLLSEEEFEGAFKALLAKEELVCQPIRGKGGVSALRNYIEKTRRLLRENIAP